jgi:hypothetical protein
MVARRSKIVNRICGLARYAGEETGGLVVHPRHTGGEDEFSGFSRVDHVASGHPP